jgi:hypothetical protein
MNDTSSQVLNSSSLTDGWVSGPNSRSTFDVIWTCFFAIFVCTFTVLHLNVPASTDTHAQILLRKVKWMVYSIVIPELVTACAFAQYVAARKSVETMAKIEGMKEWSMRHAFYWNMGGVWILCKGEETGFPINAAQYLQLVDKKIVTGSIISGREIWDKSKADRFAKALACVQISWLSVECIARTIQKLPISVLEVATVGFALPSIATYGLWFSKPSDIGVPTTIKLDLTLTELLDTLLCSHNYVWRDTPLDALDITNTVNRPSFVSEIVLKSNRWPGRKKYEGPPQRIRNDVFSLKYKKRDQLFVGFIWLAYGAIHTTAWNFEFPTHVERLLWRIASLVMSGSMVYFWIVGNRKFYLLFGYLMPSKRKAMEKVSDERRQVSPIQISLSIAGVILYLVARICLIVQALISLRALPVGVFETVRWSQFIPHI